MSFNIFVPLIVFENDFSFYLVDSKPEANKVSNLQLQNVSRGI